MLSQRVDQVLVWHGRRESRLCAGALDGSCQQRLDAVAMPAELGAVILWDGLRAAVDVGDPIRSARVLLSHKAEPLEPTQDDVVPAVAELLVVCDHPGASDGEDRRSPPVLRFVSRLQQHDADCAVAVQGVADHRAVSQLEDV